MPEQLGTVTTLARAEDGLECPPARTAIGENRAVLRDAGGHFIEGTRPGPGRHPLADGRAAFRAEAARQFTAEVHASAIAGFIQDVLARRPWAVAEYLRLFAGDGKAAFSGQAVVIKIISGVSERQL
jgi:hypothetical protein